MSAWIARCCMHAKLRQAGRGRGELATQKLGPPLFRPLLPSPVPAYSFVSPTAAHRASSIGIDPAESTPYRLSPACARAWSEAAVARVGRPGPPIDTAGQEGGTDERANPS